MRLLVLLLVSILGPDPGVRPNKSVNEQHSLPVFYDQVLAAKGFPSPLIRARVGQQEVLFIVDTGAGVNTLAAWLVEEAEIATKHTGSTARGSTGEESPVSVTYGVRGTWSDGRTFELHEAIVVQFPPLFKTYRIGGLISPQLLAPPGSAAVLDLTKPSLDFQALDQALAAIGNVSQASPPGLVTVCRNPESQFVNVLYSAPIRVSGEAGTVLVDTGATVTILQPDSAIGRKLQNRSVSGGQTQGVGGASEAERRVPGVRLERGGSTVELQPALARVSPGCGHDGLLGMDALRNCVLVLGERTMAVSCHDAASVRDTK